jgi:hypothetical protein
MSENFEKKRHSALSSDISSQREEATEGALDQTISKSDSPPNSLDAEENQGLPDVARTQLDQTTNETNPVQENLNSREDLDPLSGGARLARSRMETFSDNPDPAVRERVRTAYDFYKAHGMHEDEIPSHLAGINFHHEVTVAQGKPGDIRFRYVTEAESVGSTEASKEKTGDYFTEYSRQESLGIVGDSTQREERRIEAYVATKPYVELKSTAADIHDWTGTPELNYGGGPQSFVPRDSGFERVFERSSGSDGLTSGPSESATTSNSEVDQFKTGPENRVRYAEDDLDS